MDVVDRVSKVDGNEAETDLNTTHNRSFFSKDHNYSPIVCTTRRITMMRVAILYYDLFVEFSFLLTSTKDADEDFMNDVTRFANT